MHNSLFSFFVCLILSCSVITLNAASQQPFVFSAEEEHIKNELIDAFAQAGTDSVKVTDACTKFETARVEALKSNQYALIDWILFDSVRSITSVRSEYLAEALNVSLAHLVNTNQHNPLSLLIKKRWIIISGDLFPRAENIDVYEFIQNKNVILSFILEMHKSKTTFMLADTLLIADLLTLKHLTFGGAYAEGAVLEKLPGFNGREFINRLKLNFELPTFERLNEYFGQKVWGGHVSYSTEKVVPQLDSDTEITCGECLLQEGGSATLNEIQGPAECGNETKITYAFRKPKDEKLSSIIIQIYSGYTTDIAVPPRAAYSLPDKSVGTIDLSLPDCVSDLYQGDQLKPENFTMTHARYMRIVSDFISRIKDVYPGISIFLKGISFGGFFVSSYALLQSVELGSNAFEEIYPEFVKSGFKKNFGQTKLAMIDGVISCFGATWRMDEIVHTPGWSQYLMIPSFYHFNFDDDRVDFFSAVNAVLPLKDNYNPNVSLSVNRREIKCFLEDAKTLSIKDVSEVKTILVEDGYKSTMLGHGLSSNKSLEDQVVHFVRSSKAIIPLRIAREKRLLEMYKSERKRLFELSNFSAVDLFNDTKQFLFNLRKIRREKIQGSFFTEEEHLCNAMFLIFGNFGDVVNNFARTYYSGSLDKFNEIKGNFAQELLVENNLDLLNESNNHAANEIISRMILFFTSKFPSFEKFYYKEKKRYYDNLMLYVAMNSLYEQDVTEEESAKKLSFLRSKDEDLQQFLSNLRNTQKRIERDGAIGRDAVVESHMNLVNGDIEQVCFDFGKSLKDAGKIVLTKTKRFSVFSFENEAFDVFVKKKKEALKESFSDVMPQNLQNQVLLDELIVYPGFKDFYANAQKQYHDELMKSVSTRGLWKEAFKAVKLHIWGEG